MIQAIIDALFEPANVSRQPPPTLVEPAEPQASRYEGGIVVDLFWNYYKEHELIETEKFTVIADEEEAKGEGLAPEVYSEEYARIKQKASD